MIMNNLNNLVKRYKEAEFLGQLNNASEETMRSWINELLIIFGWDVMNTCQVFQEKTLSKSEKNKLKNIGSTNTRPDYTLVNGKIKLFFLDAKDIDVKIETDKSAAFQIRSYGWSIGAPFSILTNFKELAIYDCTQKPNINEPASFSRLSYIKYEDFVDNFDTLKQFLYRKNVVENRCQVINRQSISLNDDFADMLCNSRINIGNAIINAIKEDVDLETVSIWSQIIINRILFIRVCEAKGLEEEGLLKQFSSQGFWKIFKHCSYFEFYEHYDGPLFKRLEYLQELNIDNAVFDELISYLYYPSPYRFDVIPIKTLSDVYDLFLGYELKYDEMGELKNSLRSEFKKSNGVVTTPEQVVKNVLARTFVSEMNKLSNEDLLKLKIVDPACGSGVFLIAAYEFISQLIINNILSGDKTFTNFILINNSPILTIEGKKKIINSCLYGVDINPEAVEVAKMSLSLKMIDDFEPFVFEEVGMNKKFLLKEIGNNIKCGNSLVSKDAIERYEGLKNNIEERKITKVFDWHFEFSDVFKNQGFDYVIGNPPYVEVKNYNVDMMYMAMYIKDTYSSSKNGKIDLAIPFIEKGINLLNQKGKLGYIVQKRFFKTEYGKGIRKFLTKGSYVNTIYDYVETDLFADCITYVAIIVCDKNVNNNKKIKYYSSLNDDEILIPSESIGSTPWTFDNIELNNIRINVGKRNQLMKDVCHVKVGIQVLWDRAYHINVDKIENGYLYGKSGVDEDVKIELAACRPLVCNEKFHSLSTIKYSTYAIFPYDVKDSIATQIDYSDFSSRYPLAGSYLSKHRQEIISNVEVLPTKDEKYSMLEHWHLYTRANNHSATGMKICVLMTAKRPQACVVKDLNVYSDNANMSFIVIDEDNEKYLYALSAIICSKIFMLFAQSIANPQSGGYMKFNKQF